MDEMGSYVPNASRRVLGILVFFFGKPLLRGCHSGPVWPVWFRSVWSVRFQSVQSVQFRSVQSGSSRSSRSGSGRSGLVPVGPVGPVPVGPLFYMSNCRVKNAALGIQLRGIQA